MQLVRNMLYVPVPAIHVPSVSPPHTLNFILLAFTTVKSLFINGWKLYLYIHDKIYSKII